jgi:transcriptional regulator with XRE-family HTH domain
MKNKEFNSEKMAADILAFRGRKNLTLREFSDRVGISCATAYRAEAGNMIDLRALALISNTLDVQVQRYFK